MPNHSPGHRVYKLAGNSLIQLFCFGADLLFLLTLPSAFAKESRCSSVGEKAHSAIQHFEAAFVDGVADELTVPGMETPSPGGPAHLDLIRGRN